MKISQKGFTIIELVVALSVSVFIIITIAGIFISVIQQQKSILREQEILNQVNGAIESMSRKTRIAYIDFSGAACLGTIESYFLLNHYDSAAQFYQGARFWSWQDIPYDGSCNDFYLDPDGSLKQYLLENTYNLISPNPLNNFTIKHARFVINGDKVISGDSISPDSPQTRLSISLNILTETSSGQKERVFQTTISRRDFGRLFQQ